MMKRSSAQSRGEAGDSLVEILAAMAIVTTTLTVLVVSLSTGVVGVRTADRLVTASNLASVQLESIKAAQYVTGTLGYPAIPGDAYAIGQEVSYWDGSAFTSVPGVDSGMQWITVTVSHGGDVLIAISNYKVNR
jgi:type II secretory pathway pseudopilin PulG